LELLLLRLALVHKNCKHLERVFDLGDSCIDHEVGDNLCFLEQLLVFLHLVPQASFFVPGQAKELVSIVLEKLLVDLILSAIRVACDQLD